MILVVATAAAVEFGPATVPVGASITSSHDTELHVELDIVKDGRPYLRRIDRVHQQRSLLERLEEGFVVQWMHNRHRALEPGYQHDRVLPVVGHRYRVTDRITRQDGLHPSTEELDIVGQVDLLDLLVTLRAMLGDDLPVGGDVPAGPMFAGILRAAPGPAKAEGTVTLERIAEQDGREYGVLALDLKLTARGTDERGVLVDTLVQATGNASIELETGWTTRLTLAGPVTLSGTREGLVMSGTGHFRTETELRFHP